MNRDFLNKKEIPTPNQLMMVFFGPKEDLKKVRQKIIDDYATVDFDSLGNPHHVKSIKGTEWIVYRFEWDVLGDKVFRIDVRKIDNGFTNPIFPYGIDVIDVEHEEIIDEAELSFKELLEIALEFEDYDEAVRLREWDKGFKTLLTTIKPQILQAIKDENINALENALIQIQNYRKTLYIR
jgi:hypothetical protein